MLAFIQRIQEERHLHISVSKYILLLYVFCRKDFPPIVIPVLLQNEIHNYTGEPSPLPEGQKLQQHTV